MGRDHALLVGKQEGKRQKDQDVDVWTILGWILKRLAEVVWTGLLWLRICTSGDLL
jgi:hypothetical protein